MPADTDKYPAESDRRRFVKGVVGGASLASVASVSGSAIDITTAPSGAGGGVRQYLGIELVGGPAPRGMPMIPVEVDSDGFLKGVWPEPEERTEGGRTITVAEMDLGGETYSSEWYQYCGVQTYPGVQPDADQDNFFRYTQQAQYDWMEDVSGGDRMHIDDFSDFETWGNGIGRSGLGKPASGTWRSQGVPPSGTMPVEIIRIAPKVYDEMVANSEHGQWIEAATDEYVMAHLNKCTHFCCVPGFKTSEYSEFQAEDRVYCQCHQSVYDPFSVIKKQFVALPRPEADG
jgi:Rieske Fe-S protein